MEPAEIEDEKNPREEWINELRRKYLDGNIESILIPDNPKLDRLMEDLFPEDTNPADH